ncbi:hypothetical protein [Myxococcus sp. Y35]|uniref:hypothetical protein n=1 Tax=Pseudomyxococcus flavus TaxID=3115648 RepID=UPI003CFB3FEE
MRLYIAALFVCLLSASTAHGMDIAPSLHPHEVAAVRKDVDIAVNNLIKMYGEKSGLKPGQRPSAAGMKCLVHYAANLVMTKHIAKVTDKAQLTRWRQAAEFYNQKSLKDCDPNGGPPNDGLVLIVVAAQMEGAKKQNVNKVQDLWDDFKEAAGKAFSGQRIGPREVVVIVGVGSLILLKEMVPSPL